MSPESGLAVIFMVAEGLTLIWGVYEHLSRRDIKSKAEVWLHDAQGIAFACTALKEDCMKGRATAEEAGGRVSTISSAASRLFASIKDALD